MHVHKHQLYL